MNRKLLLFSMIIFAGCGNIRTGQPGQNVSTDHTLTIEKRDKPLTEAERLRKHQKESFEAEFRMAVYHDLNDTIKADFNGDGYNDRAIFTTENGKKGILITDGRKKQSTRIGLGKPIGKIGDDLNWVDYWGLVKDSSTFKIIIKNSEVVGDTIIKLDNPSIAVRKTESGGGLITFRKGRYEWIHQAD